MIILSFFICVKNNTYATISMKFFMQSVLPLNTHVIKNLYNSDVLLTSTLNLPQITNNLFLGENGA